MTYFIKYVLSYEDNKSQHSYLGVIATIAKRTNMDLLRNF